MLSRQEEEEEEHVFILKSKNRIMFILSRERVLFFLSQCKKKKKRVSVSQSADVKMNILNKRVAIDDDTKEYKTPHLRLKIIYYLVFYMFCNRVVPPAL